jgi:hypothetical protein
MPPLYGEGQNAFIRLQLEILTKLDDDSILAWEGPVPWGYSGLLAPSPNNFFTSSYIAQANIDPNRPPHVMTSKGLAVQFAHKVNGSTCLALLNCAWDMGLAWESPVAIGLPLHLSDTDGTWRRGPNLLAFQDGSDNRLLNNGLFYVPQVSAQAEFAFDSIRVVGRFPSGFGFQVEDAWVQDPNMRADWVFEIAHSDIPHLVEFIKSESLAGITFWNEKFGKFGLLLGISKGRLWIDLMTLHRRELVANWETFAEATATVQDRVSETLCEGSINVKICGTKFFQRIVEVSFDPEGKLRWPRRVTRYFGVLWMKSSLLLL